MKMRLPAKGLLSGEDPYPVLAMRIHSKTKRERTTQDGANASILITQSGWIFYRHLGWRRFALLLPKEMKICGVNA